MLFLAWYWPRASSSSLKVPAAVEATTLEAATHSFRQAGSNCEPGTTKAWQPGAEQVVEACSAMWSISSKPAMSLLHVGSCEPEVALCGDECSAQ